MKPKIGSWEWWQRDEDSPVPPEPLLPPPVEPRIKTPGTSRIKERDKDGYVVGYVYYIGDGHERVKIGFSANPWARTQENRTFNPSIQLLAFEKGTLQLEAKRHQQFKSELISREWFRLSERLRDWIEFLDSPHNIMKRGSDFDAISST